MHAGQRHNRAGTGCWQPQKSWNPLAHHRTWRRCRSTQYTRSEHKASAAGDTVGLGDCAVPAEALRRRAKNTMIPTMTMSSHSSGPGRRHHQIVRQGESALLPVSNSSLEVGLKARLLQRLACCASFTKTSIEEYGLTFGFSASRWRGMVQRSWHTDRPAQLSQDQRARAAGLPDPRLLPMLCQPLRAPFQTVRAVQQRACLAAVGGA